MMQDSILMLMSKYHKFSGHVRVVENLSIGLDKLGFDVSIASPIWEKDPPECIKKIYLNRFKTIDSQIPNEISLIHNHQTLMNYYSLFTKRPFIFHYHGASMFLQRINLKVSMKLCRNHISKIISVSYAADNQINEIVKNIPSQIIYNGVNNRLYHNIKNIEKDGEPQLLFVGNLFEYKKVQNIINAMEKIVITHPNAFLQIVGNGKYFGNLQNQIIQKKLEKYIELCGRITDEQLQQMYASCDLYVSASSWEMFGLPILEAMAYGKPSAVSNIPAHKELIEASKAGKVFEQDINDIYKKIIEVFEKKDQLSLDAKKFANEHTWEKVCQKIGNVYDGILSDKNNRL